MRDTERDDPLRAACPATCPRLPDQERIGLTHRFVEANGLRFHVVEAGQGPLVLLLHGFPEFWYGWRHQLPALAERFHVVAPDLRGYNLSDKPVSGYDWRTLASDVPALIQALGAERAHVVGHDWGGVVAWGAAILHPEMIDRLVILNAPHPAAYQRELRRSPMQWLRSWYVALFQVPGLAEWMLTRGHGRGVADLLRSSTVDPETFSTAELAAYRRAILRPGAATATLAYYRAMMTDMAEHLAQAERRIEAETLLIWGERDIALDRSLSEGLETWVPRIRVAQVPEAGHWLHHERPAHVNALLTQGLGAEGSGCQVSGFGN